MTEEKYYVIYSGECGIDIDEMDEEELLNRINPHKNGDFYYGADTAPRFLGHVPGFDNGYFYSLDLGGKEELKKGPLLIIKGKIIIPQINVVERKE